jgi:predicted lipid carrier protein YhbT
MNSPLPPSVTFADGSGGADIGPGPAPTPKELPPLPLTLMRGAATVLPRPVVARVAATVIRSLERLHPRLFSNLARLEPAVVHIVPADLPYRFELKLGVEPVGFAIVDRDATGADAEIAASVATFIDLLEGKIDSDTLFFRRDLKIFGNTSVIVGLRNVLDREELNITTIFAAPLGPLRSPARAVVRLCDRFLDRLGARAAAMHRTLHLSADSDKDLTSDLERCRSEIAALTSRLGRLEAQLNRRNRNSP